MPKRDQNGRGSYRNGTSNKRRNNGEPSNQPHRKAIPINANPNLDLQKLEKMLAKEYYDKPKDERERLVNEFHGVSSRALPETAKMIDSALCSFQWSVDNTVPEHEKGAYYKARSMKSTYIRSIPFRTKFLRAEFFDPKKAALRYVRYLDFLLEKFGEFALMRQLYLSDLSREERNFLKKGYIQILPFRDSVGRRIHINLGSYGGLEFSMLAKERVGAYLIFSVLSEDVTTQRKGGMFISSVVSSVFEL